MEVRRGKRYDQKIIYVHDTNERSFYFAPHKESLYDYLYDGVDFINLNCVCASLPQQYSFGVTFGSVEYVVGWFASLMSGLDFRGYSAGKSDDVVELTGESASSRLSVIGGIIFGDVVGFKIGAGFGMRTKCWEATDGNWYKNSVNSTAGIDLTAGLQLNLKHATFSVDMVTLNFRTIELKLGIGVNWKK